MRPRRRPQAGCCKQDAKCFAHIKSSSVVEENKKNETKATQISSEYNQKIHQLYSELIAHNTASLGKNILCGVAQPLLQIIEYRRRGLILCHPHCSQNMTAIHELLSRPLCLIILVRRLLPQSLFECYAFGTQHHFIWWHMQNGGQHLTAHFFPLHLHLGTRGLL